MRNPSSHNSPVKAQKLLSILKSAARDGAIFCPITDSTLFELLKQSDKESRRATAAIVDELSLGVALVEEEVREATELAHFLYSFGGNDNLHPLHHLVWTSLSCAVGIYHPTDPSLDAPTELALQKAFFDYMSSLPLTKIIETLDDWTPPDKEFEGVAHNINRGVQENSHQIRSFKQAYAAEIRGAFDTSLNSLPDLIYEMARAHGVPPSQQSEENAQRMKREYAAFFSRCLEQNKARDRFRSNHIYASLHAALRWDKSRKFKANDVYDFHHAVAALGYCKVFLTEKSMKSIVTQKNIQLDQFFGCKVAAGIDDALTTLSDVLAS